MDGEMKLNEDEVLHQPSISVQDPAKHSFSFEAGHFRPAEMGHLAGVCACHNWHRCETSAAHYITLIY